MFKPVYRPSIRCASLIMRLCVAATLTSGALWYVIPAARLPWIGGALLAAMLLAAVMGAWHDGHAIGEQKGRENGSALILILVAIVLFAGLTAVMNQSSRTSGGMMSDQQARLAATEIIAYGNELRQAVQAKLLQGCSETQLDFANAAWTLADGTPIHTEGHNENATENCAIFSHGGIHPVVFPPSHITESHSTGTQSGHGRIIRAKLPGVGHEDEQELLYRAAGIRPEICLKINELLNVKNPDSRVPLHTGSNTTVYNGVLNTGTPWTSVDGAIVGKTVFCAKHSTSVGPWDYSYIQVLIVR